MIKKAENYCADRGGLWFINLSRQTTIYCNDGSGIFVKDMLMDLRNKQQRKIE